jgi:3-hydroxybutyryl-CoA dehydratase
MTTLTNIPFDQLSIHQQAHYSKVVTEQDVQLFASLSGDANPIHLDESYAQTTQFKQRIAHGMLTGAVISAAIAMKLPGPGTIYLGQSLRFKRPVMLGDSITVTLTVLEKHESKPRVKLQCEVHNQHNELVADGEAEVLAPTEQQTLTLAALPEVRMTPPSAS